MGVGHSTAAAAAATECVTVSVLRQQVIESPKGNHPKHVPRHAAKLTARGQTSVKGAQQQTSAQWGATWLDGLSVTMCATASSAASNTPSVTSSAGKDSIVRSIQSSTCAPAKREHGAACN